MQDRFPRKDEKQKNRQQKREVAGLSTREERTGEEAKKKVPCFSVVSKAEDEGGGREGVNGGKGVVADTG